MKIIIYKQIFQARLDEEFYKAKVQLIVEEDNELTYQVKITFFNECDEYSLDKIIYQGITQRNSKREDVFLDALPIHVNQMCDALGGSIYFDQPLTEAIYK